MSRVILPFAVKFKLGKYIERHKTALLQVTRAEAHEIIVKDLGIAEITYEHVRAIENEIGLKRQNGSGAASPKSGRKIATLAKAMISMNERLISQGFESVLLPGEVGELQRLFVDSKHGD
jgi:hypothetical protein